MHQNSLETHKRSMHHSSEEIQEYKMNQYRSETHMMIMNQ